MIPGNSVSYIFELIVALLFPGNSIKCVIDIKLHFCRKWALDIECELSEDYYTDWECYMTIPLTWIKKMLNIE